MSNAWSTLLCALMMLFIGETAGAQPPDAAANATAQEAARREKVAGQIRRYFPDLDENVLAGWVDSYSELSEAELDAILKERREMQSLLSGNGPKKPLPEAMSLPDLFDPRAMSSGGFLSAREAVIRRNLLNAETAGFRRRVVVARADSSAEGEGDPELIDVGFDWKPGAGQPTGQPLHLKIDDALNRFFRLEPGCLLTRCGLFERLDNGLMGQRRGDRQFVLSGEIALPDDVSRVEISSTGIVRVRTAKETPSESIQSDVRISLAVVNDLSQLTSTNGVDFHLPSGKSDLLSMKPAEHLHAQWLELSNVDIQAETAAGTRLKLIRELQR
ncbi:MAG: hypothetical protein R3C49_00385 [Planctomycetaceae bacterium]